MKKYTADFETTTKADDCRVWAYAISEIGNPEHFEYGNSLDEFMEICANPKENAVYYFIPFSSCLQSFQASGSFQMSQLFASGGQSIGVSDKIKLRECIDWRFVPHKILKVTRGKFIPS